MDIATLWITRKSDDSGPELLVAWDSYAIEANFNGWKAVCDKNLKAVGDDVMQFRYINLYIEDDEITKHFEELQTVNVERTQLLDDPQNI